MSDIVEILSSPPAEQNEIRPESFHFQYSTENVSSEIGSPAYFVVDEEPRPAERIRTVPQRAPKFKAASEPKSKKAAKAKTATAKFMAADSSSGEATARRCQTKSRRKKTVKLSKVNKDRKEAVKEMKCKIHGCPEDLKTHLQEMGVEVENAASLSYPGLDAFIEIKRQTTSNWDPVLRAYVEGEMHTEVEEHKIVVLDATKCPVFKDLSKIREIDRLCGKSCLYVVEKFANLLKAETNAYNRKLQQMTRAALNDNQSTLSPLRPPPDNAHYMRQQVQLQLSHERNIIYTVKRAETLARVADLLQDMAAARYQNKKFVNVHAKAVKSKTEPHEIMTEALFQVPGTSKRGATEMSRHFQSMGEFVAQAARKELGVSDSMQDALTRLVTSMNPDEII